MPTPLSSLQSGVDTESGALGNRSFEHVGMSNKRPMVNRSLRNYLTGQTITVSGNWAQTVALAVLVADMGASAFVVGLVAAVRQLPLLVFGPLTAGRVAPDARRSVIVVMQSAGAGITAVFAVFVFVDTVTVSGALTFAFILGLCNVIDAPSRIAFVSDLVEPEETSRAVSLGNVASGMSRALGPLAAAGLLGIADISLVFILNAISYFIGALLFRRAVPLQRTRSVSKDRQLVGVRLAVSLLATSPLGPIILLTLGVSVLALNTQVVILFLIRSEFGGGDVSFGLATAVLGAGGMLGAVLAGFWTRPTVHGVVVVSSALGVVLLLVSIVPNLGLLMPFLAIGGVLGGLYATASSSLLQLQASDIEKGPIITLYSAVFTGASPLGAALAGAITDAVGARGAFISLGGALTAISAFAGLSVWRSSAVAPTQNLQIHNTEVNGEEPANYDDD